MKQRIVWPIVAVLALAGVFLVLSQSSAQRGRRGPQPAADVPPPPTGRFVVARTTETQVLVLDTTTGHIYQVVQSDYKKFSDLPKLDGAEPAARPAPEPRPRLLPRRRPPTKDEKPQDSDPVPKVPEPK